MPKSTKTDAETGAPSWMKRSSTSPARKAPNAPSPAAIGIARTTEPTAASAAARRSFDPKQVRRRLRLAELPHPNDAQA